MLKKIIISLVMIVCVVMLGACDDIDVNFSDKYMVGGSVGGGSFNHPYDFYRDMAGEYRICYDGTVEIYFPSSNSSINPEYALAGTYQLNETQVKKLKKAIDLKQLYILDPEPDESVCDGISKNLYVYDENDALLKKCGGYMPENETFLKMYDLVKEVLNYDEQRRIKDEWIDKLKSAE